MKQIEKVGREFLPIEKDWIEKTSDIIRGIRNRCEKTVGEGGYMDSSKFVKECKHALTELKLKFSTNELGPEDQSVIDETDLLMAKMYSKEAKSDSGLLISDMNDLITILEKKDEGKMETRSDGFDTDTNQEVIDTLSDDLEAEAEVLTKSHLKEKGN